MTCRGGTVRALIPPSPRMSSLEMKQMLTISTCTLLESTILEMDRISCAVSGGAIMQLLEPAVE